MKKNLAIKVKNLSKQYTISGKKELYLTLRDKLMQLPQKIFNKQKKNTFWALKDINFEVKKGEVIGVIGCNGAGKSTLLKILSRITEPTTGKITMRGTVASLLEVGTGFNLELTGRENIFLNGAILGMSRQAIKEKFNDIVEFSGVEKFIDTPVKHYSSGMRVRLAFSVAAHLKADILLVDEVLAVGDAKFQKKCLKKMSDLSGTGRTVVFVSHDMAAIQNLCKTSLYIKNGRVRYQGLVDDVINQYLEIKNNNKTKKIFKDKKNKKAQIAKIKLESSQKITINKPVKFQVLIMLNKPKIKTYLAISIENNRSRKILFYRDIEINKDMSKPKEYGIYKYSFTIPSNLLVPGRYCINFGLSDLDNMIILDQPNEGLHFEIIDDGSIREVNRFPWRGAISTPLKMKVVKLRKD